MKQYNILVLTDHQTHSRENSVYALCAALQAHPAVQCIHLASRGNEANRAFFYDHTATELEAWPVREDVSHEQGRTALLQHTIRVALRAYDIVWLRLPRPIPAGFFPFLCGAVGEDRIINRPSGIVETGNKAFLTHFPELTPPLRYCTTVDDLWAFHEQFPIVLKPVESYGGRGVVKLQGGLIYEGETGIPFSDYRPQLEAQLARGGYLAMKYLKNVRRGDKRIVVVNGRVLGAVLRLPPKGSWICNAARGGSARPSRLTAEERRIVERLNEALLPRGIAMYGIDTLVGDDGRRVLSEVNTLSIGGIKPLAELTGRPLVERTAQLLVEYMQGNVRERRGILS